MSEPNANVELIEIPLDVEELGAGYRLDRYLGLRFSGLSRTRIHQMIERGRILCRDSGRTLTKKSIRVTSGMRLMVRRPAPDEAPVSQDFCILYQDEHLLAIAKPGKIAVHPNARYVKQTLTALFAQRFGAAHAWEYAHRLDRETSGLMLYGIHGQSATVLKDDFFQRRIQKAYLAVLRGHLGAPEEIDVPMGLALDSKIRIKMGPRPLEKGGQSAHTRFIPILRSEYREQKVTLAWALPTTGRTHQIRVHAEVMGYPLLGDKMYGLPEEHFIAVAEGQRSEEALGEQLGLQRHALHAARLSFPHPVTREAMTLECPWPEDLGGVFAAQAIRQSIEDSAVLGGALS